MKKEEMIMHYIYVKSVHLENELINHENYMETIRPDASDYLESIILSVRREMFWEIAQDIHTILQLKT